MDVAVRVLGPLEVLIDGVDVTPPAPKERALLGLLVVRRGRVVGADQLMEELWPTLAADRARRVLQVRVAALRKLLSTAGAAPLLELVAPGYRLAIADEDVDEYRFLELVERARSHAAAGDPTRASATLRDALGLWRGQPLADVQTCVSLEAEAARLNDERLDAIEDRIDADLACGRHQAVACELDALVATDALRERLWGQRVLSLYRCGRQSEALRACALVRSRLFEELGVEPGPALRALEAAVLEQRAELDWSALPMAEPTEGLAPPSSGARSDGHAESSRRAVASIPEIHYVEERRWGEPRLPGRWRRAGRPHCRTRLLLAPGDVVGGAVRAIRAPLGVILAADPLRQARDGPVGPTTRGGRRPLDRGREGGARHGRLGAGCRARAHRRRAHRDPLRRHLPGPRQGARTLRCLRSTDMRRYGLPHRTPARRRRRTHRVHRAQMGFGGRSQAVLPERLRRPGRPRTARPVPAGLGQSGRRSRVPPNRGPDRRPPRPTHGRRARPSSSTPVGIGSSRSSWRTSSPSAFQTPRWRRSTAPIT